MGERSCDAEFALAPTKPRLRPQHVRAREFGRRHRHRHHGNCTPNMPLAALKTVAKAQVSSPARRLAWRVAMAMAMAPANAQMRTEWRGRLCPALQIPNLPLLQLVGVVSRHECLYQVFAAGFCEAQPPD